MITHFAELQLHTVSIQSVKQFYHDILKFPISLESSESISFKPTEHFTLTFTEVYMALNPAHIAFEVPYSEFDNVISYLNEARVHLLQWPDGRIVDKYETGENVYFRDGDGNLLEIITHYYVKEGIVQPSGDMRILYLREVGFPVVNVVSTREWLVWVLDVKIDKEFDNFSFAIAGTAHNVLTSIHRKWIPISMFALPPMMNVIYGVTDIEYIKSVESKLEQVEIIHSSDSELQFKKYEYNFTLRVTDFNKDIPNLLNLPYSSNEF